MGFWRILFPSPQQIPRPLGGIFQIPTGFHHAGWSSQWNIEKLYRTRFGRFSGISDHLYLGSSSTIQSKTRGLRLVWRPAQLCDSSWLWSRAAWQLWQVLERNSLPHGRKRHPSFPLHLLANPSHDARYQVARTFDCPWLVCHERR